jgi:hypothetical protein
MRTNTFLKQIPPDQPGWGGKVSLSFSYPSRGWIQLAILCTAYVQGVIVALSNAVDPFPEFIEWLSSILDDRLPAEFIVDEEGQGKIFRASPVDDEKFLFEILEWMPANDKEETPIYMYVRVNKKQFLAEFLKRWDDFLENQYDPAEWEENGTRLRELDVAKIREFVAKK